MVYLQGKTLSHVVREMYVSRSTVETFTQKHGPDIMLDDFEQLTVFNKPGICLRKVHEELYDATGKWASCATVCHTVKRIGLTLQKMK